MVRVKMAETVKQAVELVEQGLHTPKLTVARRARQFTLVDCRARASGAQDGDGSCHAHHKENGRLCDLG